MLLNIGFFGFFIFQYANIDYPYIGHDYRLFISRLLDTYLHYKVDGFSIQWYTPSFGGGLPAYPNPLQAQFSLVQFLIFLVEPFRAILISSIVYSILGFLAVFFFLTDTLEFSKSAAIIGGMTFVANGFFIERVVIGHVNFITFPLISIYIFACTHPKLPTWFSACLIALTSSILVYSGGVYIGIIGIFSTLLMLPVVYLIKPSAISFRRLMTILLFGTILSILVSGSKAYASSILMADFPREVKDEYSVGWETGVGGLIFQLVGIMTTTPFLELLGKNAMTFIARLDVWTGTPYSFWELDSSLSPCLLLLLGLGTVKVLKQKPIKSKWIDKFIASILLGFAIAIIVQFSIAKGFFFETFQSLPILKSLHVNTRYTASFILPLAILGAKVFDSWARRNAKKIQTILAFISLDALIITSLWTYFLIPTDVQVRNFHMGIIEDTYQQIQAGETFQVELIIPEMNDYEVFLAHASNTSRHYEPLFRDNNEAFHPEVQYGSVFIINNDYFNMTNPTGYLFPEENGTSIYEKIKVSENEYLMDFISRHQPDWKISIIQQLLNWVSFFTALFVLLVIIIFPITIHIKDLANKKYNLKQDL